MGTVEKFLLQVSMALRDKATLLSLRKLSLTKSVARVEDVIIETGDTDKFAWGTGTFASRGATVLGNAYHHTAQLVRAKISGYSQ